MTHPELLAAVLALHQKLCDHADGLRKQQRAAMRADFAKADTAKLQQTLEELKAIAGDLGWS